MFGLAINSATFFGLTLPPYRTRMPSATSTPTISDTVVRMYPQMSFAGSESQALPVPIAQTGS